MFWIVLFLMVLFIVVSFIVAHDKAVDAGKANKIKIMEGNINLEKMVISTLEKELDRLREENRKLYTWYEHAKRLEAKIEGCNCGEKA